jgi:hypothetical protein
MRVYFGENNNLQREKKKSETHSRFSQISSRKVADADLLIGLIFGHKTCET